jgi:monoamine oxidase
MIQVDMTDIIVVGAGAAGFMVARELSRAGKRVIILEARDRIGGRIFPLDEKIFGYPAQGGGEFVHGAAPITRMLCEEAEMTFTNGGQWWNVFDGTPTVSEWVSVHDEMLEEKLRTLEYDMTVTQFLNTYFAGDEHAGLRDMTKRRIEGYDAADPERASVFALRDELLDDGGAHQMNINEGYGKLIAYLEGQCKKQGVQVVLNTAVQAINLIDQQVNISCADGIVYQAEKVIITVPPPILSTIEFTPAIPEKLAAAGKIGFGPVIKILLRFKAKWWTGARERNFGRLFFMFSNEAIPTWWTQYPETHTTLTGWVAGPSAQRLSAHSDDELLEMALVSLSNIFKISIGELRDELVVSKIINWHTDPYARGAYSYATPESATAIAELSKPVEKRLFFAGEALYTGEVGGTVEAALASGQSVAQTILHS